MAEDVKAKENKIADGENALKAPKTSEKTVEVASNEPANPPIKRESLESALRKFKKQSSGIISEIKGRTEYLKPSVKRKKKSKEARKRNKTNRYSAGR